MSDALQPEDSFDAELDRVRRKTSPDNKDKQEDADVLKTQAEAEVLQEVVRSSRLRRQLAPGVVRAILVFTFIYAIVPILLTFLVGFKVNGFALDKSVLIASYAPLALGPVVALVKLILR